LKTARKSVTATDLDKFEQFKRKFDPSFVSKGNNSQGGPKINWPGAPGATGQGGRMQVEDDLYS
jgi:transitional endoplasmic reticulum ATPase